MSQLAYLDLQRKYKELVSGKGDISDSDSAWVTKVYFPPPSPSSFQLWRSLPLFTRIVVLWVAELLIKQADVASSRARTDGVEAFQARNLLISKPLHQPKQTSENKFLRNVLRTTGHVGGSSKDAPRKWSPSRYSDGYSSDDSYEDRRAYPSRSRSRSPARRTPSPRRHRQRSLSRSRSSSPSAKRYRSPPPPKRRHVEPERQNEMIGPEAPHAIRVDMEDQNRLEQLMKTKKRGRGSTGAVILDVAPSELDKERALAPPVLLPSDVKKKDKKHKSRKHKKDKDKYKRKKHKRESSSSSKHKKRKRHSSSGDSSSSSDSSLG